MQNKDVVRQAYELFDAGKAAEAGQLFAPDAVWHFPGRNALSGEYRGEAIAGELLPKFPALTGGTYRSRLVDVADGEKYTFALQHSHAERDGRTFEHLVCHLFTISDGLITEVRTHPYDQHGQDAFWH